ncbi:hypothetical protein SAMN05421630_11371 [Prauserella marina]|uniref:Uncharacterized protein n=1 Tax=Prauserella marina TaxID=530584 RepID=A0A1G6Y2W1_9PSEU|nr:hypothetical protein [Prauserella marina]PWV80060.1 hypothetical protein DES30_103146 [Prauserella marina]SDD84067.1 hypothetical protein SAMN05421630_11371 [Prauserella marina]
MVEHIGDYPRDDLSFAALLILTVLAVAAATAAITRFGRRDLTTTT